MGSSLKFRENGTFKIVQLTDLHIGSNEEHEPDIKTFQRIDEVIEAESPDLIAITGDLIWSHEENPEKNYKRVLDHINKWDIPFAIVYGNHDSEANITREQLFEIQTEYENSVAQYGPSDISGVGNYSLQIHSSKGEEVESVLYFLDSGDYAPKDVGGYAWIQQDQVNWFVSEAKKYRGIPSLAFFHIPLFEYHELWFWGKVSGTKNETICSPKINSGMFSALLETGDVMGTFVGHDHDNDFCGELRGISLCYGRATGYNVYGDLEKGGRVIQLYEGQKKFDSWIQVGNGEKISKYSHEERE